jgi:GNAT superfamily N-acetyltransferase
MDDRALLESMFRSLRASAVLFGRGAERNATLELDGVTAAISPATPDRSVVNSVAYEHADALEAALDDLARAYEDAGVRAWTVWTRDGDTRAISALEAAGHSLDASPRAMALELTELAEPAPPEPSWTGDWDLDAAGLVNDLAYGDPEGSWASVLGELPEHCAHLYMVRDDGGDPLSMVVVHDHEDDCAFWFAATVPAARGRGLVRGLLHRALRDARERGRRTSTTQATAMGAPVYARLGYRDLGPVHMYERRVR